MATVELASSSSDEEADYATPPSPSPLAEACAEEEAKSEPEAGEEAAAAPERTVEADPERAAAAKARGNELFRTGAYEEAAEAYSEALDYCPDDDSDNRAVYFANRAACFMQLRLFDEAVKDCTPAIELRPKYGKCIRRRARAYEELERWEEAVADWQALVDIDGGDAEARRRGAAAAKRLEEKREEQKAEMMGKLKELGNGLLGKFGLSLDNFKSVQDPKTGGYSISFDQGGGGGGNAT